MSLVLLIKIEKQTDFLTSSSTCSTNRPASVIKFSYGRSTGGGTQMDWALALPALHCRAAAKMAASPFRLTLLYMFLVESDAL